MDLAKEELRHQVFSFLTSQVVAVISTVSPEITPEAATIMYVIDENWNMYLLTHKDSRKVANIKINPQVALVVGTTIVAHTVQIEGRAQLINETDPQYVVITQKFQENALLNRDPIYGVYKDNYTIVKVTISWLRWLTFEQTTNKEVYTVLIP